MHQSSYTFQGQKKQIDTNQHKSTKNKRIKELKKRGKKRKEKKRRLAKKGGKSHVKKIRFIIAKYLCAQKVNLSAIIIRNNINWKLTPLFCFLFQHGEQ